MCECVRERKKERERERKRERERERDRESDNIQYSQYYSDNKTIRNIEKEIERTTIVQRRGVTNSRSIIRLWSSNFYRVKA